MSISGTTKLIGIFGYPVAHSFSPRMQNAAFAAMGLDLCYVPLLVEPGALPAAMAGLKAMSFVGANVTVPHKVAAAALVDQLAPTARGAGAVNTIVNQGGRLVGHNTDGAGFIRALHETVHIDFSQAAVALVGAGGAARSVALALAAEGVPRIDIINRSRRRAEELKAVLHESYPSLPVELAVEGESGDEFVAAAKIVVNATTLGMDGDLKRVPLDVDKITKEHVVCDVVYVRAQETPLMVAAREKGATTMGGLGMLLHQGAAAIQLWTGQEPPVAIMRRALESQRTDKQNQS